MSTASARIASQPSRDQRSVIATVAVTLLALLLGALVRSSAEGQYQQIERKSVSALVPAGWMVQDGVGDLIFASWDPFAPDVRYTVSLLANDGNRPLEQVAADRSAVLAKGLEAFRVVEETPVIRRGREGYKVLYAFIDAEQPGLPLVVQGLDYYFPADAEVIVISLKANTQIYDEALPRFEPFLDSVSYNSGE